ncbi:MAG: deoxyribose-phosphate aldolase [Anaerolineae bacterium]|nr:deoxyribose-phosphate aldolase [Anaerolineae bacterium]
MSYTQGEIETLVREKISVLARAVIVPGSSVKISAHDLARMIDHTLLKADATRVQVTALCQQAAEYSFASVCVNPCHVAFCADLLKRAPDVVICTVVGFPLGATLAQVKAYEAERAIDAGASEIDMVINIGALKDGDRWRAYQDVLAVAEACHSKNAHLKVIIETALLTDEEKVAACVLSQAAGADFVKTSTGFSTGGATAQDVALMRHTVGPEMGIKAAGGIRSYEDALAMIAAGATRIGASAGIKIVTQAQDLCQA